ncbi:MAG: chromosomal replication initiator protein DnaA [Treponema sp.]|nr:chromosomal replication initiator protein DnaA [Treponema sp.]MCL2251808.1 chromosomal replication initiator protein DnaA [Treponema sp.]
MADLDYEGFWKEALVQLQNDLREEEFSGWFSELKYLRHREESGANKVCSLIIGVPSSFHQKTIETRYIEKIKLKIKAVSGREIAVETEIFKISPEEKENKPVSITAQPLPLKEESSASMPITTSVGIIKEKKVKHPQMRDDFTFERYIIGENNSFAANAAIAISKNPGKAYNPFLIFGGVGQGKTHLMQAIGNYIHENSDNKVIFVTSEEFLNEYLEGIAQGKMNVFKNKFRYTDVLLIDDIQFFQKKHGIQEELFHTFNALANAKKQLVFTCDRPPSELKEFSERLISRIEQGVRADLAPPRYEERCAILKATAKSRNIEISDDIINFIGENISSNVRDLVSSLNILIAYTELMGKPITLEIAQQRLKDTFNASRNTNLLMDNIIRVVAENYGLTPNDLKGKKRTQNISFARQIAMYIGKGMTEYSTTEIGKDFGGRDHTTVMHSVEKIRNLLITDPALESNIEKLIRAIKEFSAKM